MMIVLGFYKRKPGISHEDFSRHWRDIHGPLIRNTPEIAKYIKRYVQHHLSPNTVSSSAQSLPFDGFSETWYESAEDREKLLAEPVFQSVSVPDEHRFLDMTETRYSMFDDQVVQVGRIAFP